MVLLHEAINKNNFCQTSKRESGWRGRGEKGRDANKCAGVLIIFSTFRVYLYILEANVAEKFLSHLKEGKSYTQSASIPNALQNHSPHAANCADGVVAGINKKTQQWTPHGSIPYESFYPDVGNGNNTGVFDIITGAPERSCLSPHRIVRESTTSATKISPTFAYFPPPINRSSIFGAVSLTTDQHKKYSQPRIENALYAVRTDISRMTGKDASSSERGNSICSTRVQSPSSGYSGASGKIKFTANMQAENKHEFTEKVGIAEKEIKEKEDIEETKSIAESENISEKDYITEDANISVKESSSSSSSSLSSPSSSSAAASAAAAAAVAAAVAAAATATATASSYTESEDISEKENIAGWKEKEIVDNKHSCHPCQEGQPPPKSSYTYSISGLPKDSHKDIGLCKRWPGRPYECTQFLLG